jgi:hypothetical protein
MKRAVATLFSLALLGAFLIVGSGCASTSGQKVGGVTTETQSADSSATATFDAQAIADLPTDEFQVALESLTPEQAAEVGAILEAEAAAEAAGEPAATTAPANQVYKHLTSRAFKQLVKNPDSYVGKGYYIYGEITQFDAATGTDTFRANVGPKKLRKSYGYVNYPQNSMLSGTESRLEKYVQGDLFIAKVRVLGSYSYDTQAGGNTTVPSFQVDSISRYGSTD